eukprot:PhF_6_TR32177/c0_g1_i1/m.47760
MVRRGIFCGIFTGMPMIRFGSWSPTAMNLGQSLALCIGNAILDGGIQIGSMRWGNMIVAFLPLDPKTGLNRGTPTNAKPDWENAAVICVMSDEGDTVATLKRQCAIMRDVLIMLMGPEITEPMRAQSLGSRLTTEINMVFDHLCQQMRVDLSTLVQGIPRLRNCDAGNTVTNILEAVGNADTVKNPAYYLLFHEQTLVASARLNNKDTPALTSSDMYILSLIVHAHFPPKQSITDAEQCVGILSFGTMNDWGNGFASTDVPTHPRQSMGMTQEEAEHILLPYGATVENIDSVQHKIAQEIKSKYFSQDDMQAIRVAVQVLLALRHGGNGEDGDVPSGAPTWRPRPATTTSSQPGGGGSSPMFSEPKKPVFNPAEGRNMVVWLHWMVPKSKTETVVQHVKQSLFFSQIFVETTGSESMRIVMLDDPGHTNRFVQTRQRIEERISEQPLMAIESMLCSLSMRHFVEMCPGLLHFVYVDRSNSNLVVAPNIEFLATSGSDFNLDTSPGEGNVKGLTGDVLNSVFYLKKIIWSCITNAQELIRHEFIDGLYGNVGVTQFHCLRIEGPSAYVPEEGGLVNHYMDPTLRLLYKDAPYALADRMEHMKRIGDKRGVGAYPTRSYELYAVYLGVLPITAIDEMNQKLLDRLREYFDRR